MKDETRSIVFMEDMTGFYPDGRLEWKEYFKEINMEIHNDVSIDPQESQKNVKICIDNALKVIKEGIGDTYGVLGFIQLQERSRTIPFQHDYILTAMIPLITPYDLQQLIEKIEFLEKENKNLQTQLNKV